MGQMIEALNALDTSLFLAINGTFPAWDSVMWWVSEPLYWTPLYIAMIWAAFQRVGMGRPLAVLALGTALCVTCTDVVSARVIKPSVARLRPSHEPSLQHQIHLLEERPGEIYRGGRFGFVSSHAANHMGLAIMFGGLLGGWWTWGLLAWAMLIGLSRIHLGVHYPGDVLGGWVLGWGVGAVALTLVRFWATQIKTSTNHE